MNAKLPITTRTNFSGNARFNVTGNLRPENLARALEAFDNGRLGTAARIFERILKRDDVLCGLDLKRRKSVARLDAEIVMLEDSPKARKHKKILEKFYNTISATDYSDKNSRGGLRVLISQIMDCVAMRYSAHKITFEQHGDSVRANFERYPLWLFENTSGELKLLEREGQLTDGVPLNSEEWLICKGDGLMFASSIAHLFKQLPLKDWLIYCERNGMPGIKAKTDAYPGSEQWEAARDAVSEFGAEFHAVLSQGTDIEAVDVAARGELPYPKLVERVDRILCAMWRGSDLSTISGSNQMGASVQWYESSLIEEADAANISDTLNRQVDTQVIKLSLGDEEPLAKFKLKLPDYEMHKYELEIIERLCALGLNVDKIELAKRFAFPLDGKENSDDLQ